MAWVCKQLTQLPMQPPGSSIGPPSLHLCLSLPACHVPWDCSCSFLLRRALLAVLRKARGLQHSLASAISPALLLCQPWQSPRHSSPRMLKQTLMIQDFCLLALPTSFFSPIPTYHLLSAQRSYLTTCGNKNQRKQHFEHSSLSPPVLSYKPGVETRVTAFSAFVREVSLTGGGRDEQTPRRWWNSFYQEKGGEDMSMQSLFIKWIRLDSKLHAVCCPQQWYRIQSSLWCERIDKKGPVEWQ